MMYTPGGSPIFTGPMQKARRIKQGKPMFGCTECEHRHTSKQAKANQWNCNHCGSPLKAKAHKVEELHRLAKDLGMTVSGENT